MTASGYNSCETPAERDRAFLGTTELHLVSIGVAVDFVIQTRQYWPDWVDGHFSAQAEVEFNGKFVMTAQLETKLR